MDLLSGYDLGNLTVGSLGGHSALDICHGAKKFGLNTVVVAKRGREKTYEKYFRVCDSKGCVDSIILVGQFQDILQESIQQQLRSLNTIFVHSRYFWVYFDDFSHVERGFRVPIFGSRHLLRLEERDQEYTQYDLLRDAGIRIPKLYKQLAASDERVVIDRPVIVKASEAQRIYERAFFIVSSDEEYERTGSRLEAEGKIAGNWRQAPIEEFIVGAPVNFNFFYSPLTGELELLGTDMRRQTNLDGFLRLTAEQQSQARQSIDLKMVETGHVACTVKESLLENVFEMGERFVRATQSLPEGIDPSRQGIIGPFALQGSVVTEEGREDIVIFDVSFRIPGSPGIRATPYSAYRYGESISMGERIGMEVRKAVENGQLEKIVT